MLLGSLVQASGKDNVAKYAGDKSKLFLFKKKRVVLNMFKSDIEILPQVNIINHEDFYNTVCLEDYPDIIFYGTTLTMLPGQQYNLVTIAYNVPLKNITYFSIVYADTMDKALNASRAAFNKYTGIKNINPDMIQQVLKNNTGLKYKVVTTGLAILRRK